MAGMKKSMMAALNFICDNYYVSLHTIYYVEVLTYSAVLPRDGPRTAAQPMTAPRL